MACYLPEGPPVFDADDITDRSERFMASEILREKLFRNLGEELPYGIAVEIEKFEQEGELRRIHAAVIVDRAGHRAIVIGKDGERLKRISTDARKEMETLFGGKVWLETWVKVKGGWADDERALKSPWATNRTVSKRVDGQSAYVLHLHPYSETSLVVDVFTRDHGRVPLLARGARRPRSAMRGMLMSFQPLELGWFGGGEVKTLAKAEWLGGMPLLGGRCLLLGYYLNELLLKMLPREDPHGVLFDAYAAALRALAAGAADAPELRRFEKTLLKELGYGLTLDVRNAIPASRWRRTGNTPT